MKKGRIRDFGCLSPPLRHLEDIVAFTPPFDTVYLDPFTVDEKVGSVIAPDEVRNTLYVILARVFATGPGYFLNRCVSCNGSSFAPTTVKVGDFVLTPLFGGKTLQCEIGEGEFTEFRCIREVELLGIYTPEG